MLHFFSDVRVLLCVSLISNAHLRKRDTFLLCTCGMVYTGKNNPLVYDKLLMPLLPYSSQACQQPHVVNGMLCFCPADAMGRSIFFFPGNGLGRVPLGAEGAMGGQGRVGEEREGGCQSPQGEGNGNEERGANALARVLYTSHITSRSAPSSPPFKHRFFLWGGTSFEVGNNRRM